MLNEHVKKVHLPAHIFGTLALVSALINPSWWTLLGFLIFNFWFSCLGMSVGFHRYFTHKSFTTSRFWHQIMLWGGTLAGQGSVVFWVALHRAHHPSSDTHVDVHSPKHGFWHAYMGWIFDLDPSQVKLSRAVDIIRDPVAKLTHRHYDFIMWTYWGILLGIALCFPSSRSFLVGVLIAGSWSIHQEALINSVCHDERFGEAPLATEAGDSSRNVKWLHYLTWGQSLHNNHHAYPASDNFGINESDIGHRVIKLISTKQSPRGRTEQMDRVMDAIHKR